MQVGKSLIRVIGYINLKGELHTLEIQLNLHRTVVIDKEEKFYKI